MTNPFLEKWFASDYLDIGAYGVITETSVIVIGQSAGLTMEQCQKIAIWHNKRIPAALSESSTRVHDVAKEG